MAQTITPVVYGGRGRWVAAVGLHTLGATAVAALFGAALGTLGHALGGPFGRPGGLALAGIAALYVGGTFPRLPVPTLAMRRQVPEWWRTFFTPSVAALLYGAGLGIGFFTYLATGALAVVSAAALLGGDATVGMFLLLPFGLARGLSATIAAGVRTDEDGRELVARLATHGERARRLLARASLVAIAVLAAAAAVDQGAAGWAPLASAALALVFGWAALAKVTGWRRWRRTLQDHRLPRRLADLAAWSVPLAEATVATLVAVGTPRAAAALALVLLTGFTAEVVRLIRRRGAVVPCGCFGGRRSARGSAMLLRNAGLAALALGGLAGGHDATVTWPGVPGPADVLPMVLTFVGLAVAGLAAWQARTWLGVRR